MKKTWYSFILCCFLAAFTACQNEDELGNSAMGYLRLGLEVNTSSISRAEAEAYNPKQLAVQILDAQNEVVEETTNFDTEWKGKTFTLPIGTYTIKASSAGFDGKTSGFEKPYYTGSTAVTIENGKTANPSITCTLANVKVTVQFDESFTKAFSAAKVTVDDKADNAGISPLDFEMGKTAQSGYFPVTDLQAVVSATNQHGVTNTQTDEITGVKARDHYILQYKVGDAGNGNGNVSITVDESTKTYTYTVTISTFEEPTLTVSSVNAWAKLAYLEGKALNVDTSKGTVTFQYRKKNTTDWSTVSATLENEIYKATVTGLESETTYESRLICNYKEDVFEGDVKEFTTEAATELYNGGFDLWSDATIGSGLSKHDDVPYLIDPNETIVYGTSGDKSPICFWDSGNAGAATMGEYPTTKFEENGATGALLSSQFVGMDFGITKIGKFAAGNVYTGHYFYTDMGSMGAQIFFGQPFASRPIQLKGRFKYTRGTNVDEGNDPYKSELQNSGGDQCGLYIVLTDNEGIECEGNKYAFEIDNTLSADDPDNFKYKNTIDFSEANKNIIAYGTISETEAKGTGSWQEFTIDLEYRSLTRIPKYIIVVASASKYGDFFTGSTSSVMYVDDFELVYDGEPSVQE